jgi:hypothetical protein
MTSKAWHEYAARTLKREHRDDLPTGFWRTDSLPTPEQVEKAKRMMPTADKEFTVDGVKWTYVPVQR